jgi:hypothetical protein
MNHVFVAWVAIALIMPAFGQQKSDDKKELTGQQDRMQQCSAEAKQRRLMGREGQAFISACLKGEAPVVPPKAGAQQDKTSACSKEATAKGMKGDDRNKFISECLCGPLCSETPATTGR